jgi:hypothetical protein
MKLESVYPRLPPVLPVQLGAGEARCTILKATREGQIGDSHFPLLDDRPCAGPILGKMAVLRQLWRPHLAPGAASGPLVQSRAAGLAYKVTRDFVTLQSKAERPSNPILVCNSCSKGRSEHC